MKNHLVLVTAGVKMLEMMLEKSEEKAENRAAPKKGSATWYSAAETADDVFSNDG